MHTTTRLGLVLTAALAGCANASLIGKTAPIIAGGEWVYPRHDANAPTEGRWTVLAFFLPN